MHCQCNLKCLHSYFWRQHNCVCGVFVGSPSAAAWCPVLHCGRRTEARIGKDATSLMSMWRDSLSTAPHTHWPAHEESLSTATGVLTNTTSVVHSLHVAFVYKLCIDYSDPHSVDRDIHWLLWPTFSGWESPLISITDYSHPRDGTVYRFFWPTFHG